MSVSVCVSRAPAREKIFLSPPFFFFFKKKFFKTIYANLKKNFPLLSAPLLPLRRKNSKLRGESNQRPALVSLFKRGAFWSWFLCWWPGSGGLVGWYGLLFRGWLLVRLPVLVCLGWCWFVCKIVSLPSPVAVVAFSLPSSCLCPSRCRSFVLGLPFGFFRFGSVFRFWVWFLSADPGPVLGRFSGFKKGGPVLRTVLPSFRRGPVLLSG